MKRDQYTLHYKTEWPQCDNVVISLWEDRGVPVQCGIVEVRIYKDGEHRGEAYIWNLHVNHQSRRRGYGRRLMSDAYDVAMISDCHTCVLEWSLKECPRWVFQWCTRLGYDEKEFVSGKALMKLPIKENMNTKT